MIFFIFSKNRNLTEPKGLFGHYFKKPFSIFKNKKNKKNKANTFDYHFFVF